MIVAGIDPGPGASALVVYDSALARVVWARYLPNAALEDLIIDDTAERPPMPDRVGIEWIQSYAKVVGQAVFHTCRWVGRFEAAWLERGVGTHWIQMTPNVAVRMALCGTVRCGQPQIRRALLDLHGGDAAAKKGGPLYGVKSHLWSALGVAYTISTDRSVVLPREVV